MKTHKLHCENELPLSLSAANNRAGLYSPRNLQGKVRSHGNSQHLSAVAPLHDVQEHSGHSREISSSLLAGGSLAETRKEVEEDIHK